LSGKPGLSCDSLVYLARSQLEFFKGLKLEGKKGTKGRSVSGGRLRQATRDGFFEQGEILVIGIIEAFLLHELPQPLDQIEIGRVRWEKKNLNI
jgi:hypothetical protein